MDLIKLALSDEKTFAVLKLSDSLKDEVFDTIAMKALRHENF